MGVEYFQILLIDVTFYLYHFQYVVCANKNKKNGIGG